MLLPLLVWLLFVVVITGMFYAIIEVYNRTPFYHAWFIVMSMAAILNGIMFNPQNFYEWWPVLVFQISSYWVILNPLLNILREMNFWYILADAGKLHAFLLKHRVIYIIFYLASWAAMIYSAWKISI